MLSPFRMVCRYFILPERCKLCLFSFLRNLFYLYNSADATTTDCVVVALKNLMNQMYSKDISRKSGSVLREKIKHGEFIGGYASYGYIKDPEDRHRIIVAPEAAEVVRSIFQKKLEGVSNAAIVRWLNNSGILSPCCYRHQKGILLDALSQLINKEIEQAVDTVQMAKHLFDGTEE